MANEFRVSILGLDKLKAGLQHAPELTLAELEKATRKSLVILENQSKKEAPVNKQTGGGNLRQSITSRMQTKVRGIVEARAPYSIFVHEGTRPHLIRPVNKRALANRRTGQFFGKLVHHPGTRANPFFTRTIKAVKAAINGYFAEAMKNVFKELK